MTKVTLPDEDFSPIYVGDTGSQFAPVFVDVDNNAIDLSNATISTRMTNQYGVTKVWDSANWVIDNAAGGTAHYQYESTDVDTAGVWTVQTTITVNGKPRHADERILVIETPI